MNSHLQVTIDSGIIEGRVSEYEANPEKQYFSFQGIPYARPPVGDLRFKAPLPVIPWQGVKEVKEDGNQCFSRSMIDHHEKLGSEDCLNLNVYTPELPLKEGNRTRYNLKPVMVFIHGGAYTTGSNAKLIYGPEYLLREEVVLVVINYRLGLLGFLSLDDHSLQVPGNAGFKDMVLALKWVQKNIHNFNGDPNNVTLFGESAGASSVHLLTLSPMAKGLFHKAICQSGCALNLWCRAVKTGPIIAKKLDMEKYDERRLLQTLKDMPVEDLHRLQEKIPDPWDVSCQRPVGYVLESPHQTEEPFLTEDPEILIKKGKYVHIPLLIGFNSREGMLVHASGRIKFNELSPDIESCVPNTMKLTRGSTISKKIAKKIMDFYFDGKDPDASEIDLTYKLWSDNFFIREIYLTMMWQSKTMLKPVYAYEMTIETSINLFKNYSGITTPGVCHADDIAYLFSSDIQGGVEPGSVEDIAIRRFCRLWANFASYGNPNSPKSDSLLPVVWKRFTPTEQYYLDIGQELSLKSKPVADRMEFWKEILTYRNVHHKL